jgi:hypothetical protein
MKKLYHLEFKNIFFEPSCSTTINPVASHYSSFSPLLSICEKYYFYIYRVLYTCLFIFILSSCNNNQQEPKSKTTVAEIKIATYYKTIGDIPPPEGFKRIATTAASFAEWLRQLPLKKEKQVYLFNGTLKPNQAAQYAVMDISTGEKDLQQCADVVMRLRAEYLFEQKKYDEILFQDYSGKKYKWQGAGNRKLFDAYLENVFGWCGSASLEKQLTQVSSINDMQPGDVFIKGGFPGHAVTVVDMAVNNKGEKVYMLLQGYQPAQDMHLLINPADVSISPWYSIGNEEKIVTPEWVFYKSQLRRWPAVNSN